MINDEIPEWVREVYEEVASILGFMDGLSGFEGYYWPPEDSEYGLDHIQMAPELLEVAEGGPNDGDSVAGIAWGWDLARLQELFANLDSFSYGVLDGRARFALVGAFREHELELEIFTEPFEGAAVNGFVERGGIAPA